MWINIEPSERAIIERTPGMDWLVQKMKEHDEDTAAHELTIQAARSNYADDDINIDEGCPLSIAEGGVWVGAWVWVALDDIN